MKITTMIFAGILACIPLLIKAQTNEINLKTALARTIERHPDLQVFQQQIAIYNANRLQAGLTPNPELAYSLENVLGTNDAKGLGNAEHTLMLNQVIELGTKRQQRINLADQNFKAYLAKYQLIKLNILTDSTEQYYQVLKSQSLLKWKREQQRVIEYALNAIKQRAKAGAVSNADVARMQYQHSQLKLELSQLAIQYKLDKTRLAQKWLGAVDFTHAAGDISLAITLPKLANLHDQVDLAPEALLLQIQSDTELTQLALVEANSQADLSLGAGVRYDDASNSASLLFEAAMPLQFNNPQSGNIKASQSKLALLNKQQALVRKSLKQQISELHLTLQSQQSQLKLQQTELLPMAKQLVAQSLKSYELGQISVLQLLDAHQTQFDTERAIINAQTSLLQNLLTLQRLSGQTLIKG